MKSESKNYISIKLFRWIAYAYINQGKLAPTALKGKFIDYPDRVKDYKLWCSDINPPRCIISRDMVIKELC